MDPEKRKMRRPEIRSLPFFSSLLKLEVGTLTDTVSVEASTVRVQTTDATIQRAVTLRDIDTLPQLGRSPIAPATYQPGVQLARARTTRVSPASTGCAQLSLRRQAGALKFAVNYTWSKTIDNASVHGSGNTGPLDNYRRTTCSTR